MSRTTLPMTRVIDRPSLPSINFLILPFQGDYHPQDVHPPDNCCQHPDQTVEVTHVEQKKKWTDIDDDRKKQLEVQISLILDSCQATHDHPARRWAFGRCGPSRRWLYGLAAPPEENRTGSEFRTALLRLFFANLPSSKKQELTWGAQSWQSDAYARTEEFRNHGPRSPTSWVLVEGREKIPRSALEAGKDKDGNSIYIARAFFEGGTRTFDGSDFFLPSMFHGYL